MTDATVTPFLAQVSEYTEECLGLKILGPFAGPCRFKSGPGHHVLNKIHSLNHIFIRILNRIIRSRLESFVPLGRNE